MDTAAFDFNLPAERIAQVPAPRREQSRLLVYDRNSAAINHCQFSDLPDLLPQHTVIFRNTVAVLPARLKGRRPTGGAVECLLLQPADNNCCWQCLLKPGRKLPVGSSFTLAGGADATIVSRGEDGNATVQFKLPEPFVDVENYAQRFGELPLPPYIQRDNSQPEISALDRDRYQTVYADRQSCTAVAAPTAGLHFTAEIFAALKGRGIAVHDLILDVGVGTFRPIQTDRLEDHRMHSETYRIPPQAQQALYHPGEKKRLAVGTTSLRAIEDYFTKTNSPANETFRDGASIFIYPPRTFHGVDALLTNFHLPRSTLLCLVAAFLAPGSTEGIPLLHHIYAEAIARKYRFFSYGDAMLIL